jgi:tetratricopeptide (TPR) repeat protein
MGRRYERALEEVTETIQMDPTYTALYYYLGQLYERLGACGRAIEAFQKASQESESRGTAILAAIGYTHARAGDREAAVGVLTQLEALAEREYVSPFDLALLHLALGDRERALAHLARACDDCSSFLVFADVDSRLDELRAEPQFRALLERMNFPSVR